MSTRDEGEPAFPVNERHADGSHYFSHFGMTLRDYFAAAALQGLCAEEVHAIGMDQKSKYTQIASKAYQYADAMLRERTK